MKSTRQLGVSFYDNRIQIAEVEQGKQPLVTVLAERESSLDMSSEGAHLSADNPKISSIVEELSGLLRQSKVNAGMISYALPTNPVFIHTFPVDPTLENEELQEYLSWELRQYFPGSGPKDFITDAHVIPSKDKDARRTFMVGVQRGIVAFLQKVSAGLKLKLQIIDIDHFSSEKTFKANYPELQKDVAVLLGIGGSGVDASVVKNHEMVGYRSYPDASASLGATIKNYLKHIKQQDDVQKVAGLYLHGSQVPSDSLASLKSETGVTAFSVNAFRKLAAASSVDKALVKESHRFAAAIGLALRAS
ncbi:MAG: hypothetical protein L0Y80_00565 [Ignavibacteriae bacterium]|nr:hypothetical protein [Ignavibacteriota bacterium]